MPGDRLPPPPPRGGRSMFKCSFVAMSCLFLCQVFDECLFICLFASFCLDAGGPLAPQGRGGRPPRGWTASPELCIICTMIIIIIIINISSSSSSSSSSCSVFIIINIDMCIYIYMYRYYYDDHYQCSSSSISFGGQARIIMNPC